MISNKVQAKHLVEAKGPEAGGDPRDMFASRRFRYLMINVVSRRARELNRGEKAQVSMPGASTVELAMAEVKNDLVKIARKQKSKVMVSMIKND